MSTDRPTFALAVLALVAAVAGLLAAHQARRPAALPYTRVVYDVADARAAFAAEGIRLTPRSHSVTATTLGNAHDVLEVDVFGDPKVVRRYFQDLPHARDCAVAGHLALHWRGNVRAIVNCDLVANDRVWIARMDRALARLR